MYQDFFGLSAKPFQLTPDPNFFYASKEHKRAMAYLQYGLEQGEGFIVVSGAIGTGKSTIAKHLIADLNTQQVSAIQLVTTCLAPLDLLQLIASGFGIVTDNLLDKASLLQQIERFLNHNFDQGRRTLLLVDEAQNLPPESIEELRMLSNIQRDNQPLLQSFLLGQEELRDTLKGSNMEQFRQRIIASCHLPPLTEPECQQYIQHRLNHVGWQNNPSFEAASFALIHQTTRGIPRLINLFCDRLMLFCYLEENSHISCEDVDTVSQEFIQEQEYATLPPKAETVATQSLNHDNNDDAAVFRHHLEEVLQYLDKTMMEKLKLLKYLDKVLKDKNNQAKFANKT
ncbi:XrtA/PEP-CTERM system-associated ATPase [Motilimonas pumila]|uniref:General secretion pathway protein GspA n=1 Tax=Motilimonas pumila TaxID=2303987 RepID=A0A418YHA5_9GAMM|nr:XrtA/PEP-CTERM system-associated ATPase [Motilimonas pumila]RJG49470.1 general secretion pathway protein GspA [Motilimonas pumila]